VFNLGSVEEVSIAELAEMVKTQTDSPSTSYCTVRGSLRRRLRRHAPPRAGHDQGRGAGRLSPDADLSQILDSVIAYQRRRPSPAERAVAVTAG